MRAKKTRRYEGRMQTFGQCAGRRTMTIALNGNLGNGFEVLFRSASPPTGISAPERDERRVDQSTLEWGCCPPGNCARNVRSGSTWRTRFVAETNMDVAPSYPALVACNDTSEMWVLAAVLTRGNAYSTLAVSGPLDHRLGDWRC